MFSYCRIVVLLTAGEFGNNEVFTLLMTLIQYRENIYHLHWNIGGVLNPRSCSVFYLGKFEPTGGKLVYKQTIVFNNVPSGTDNVDTLTPLSLFYLFIFD